VTFLKGIAPLLIAGATAAAGYLSAGMMRHCSESLRLVPVVWSSVIIVGVFALSFRGKLSAGAGFVALLLGVVGNLGLMAGCF
jgi:hypothetical protein